MAEKDKKSLDLKQPPPRPMDPAESLKMQTSTAPAANDPTIQSQSTEATGLPVKGYRPTQPQWAIDLVNNFKTLEELVLRQIDEIREEDRIDRRSLAVAVTQLQGAFMWVNRAIFQPQRIALSEDPPSRRSPFPDE